MSEESRRHWRHPQGVQEEKHSERERDKVKRQEGEVVVKEVLDIYDEINGLSKPFSAQMFAGEI